jgi:hypothetical protein
MDNQLYVYDCVGNWINKNVDIFQLLTSNRNFFIEGTNFTGMKCPHLDGSPYNNFLVHKTQDVIANFIIPKNKIFLLSYKEQKKYSGNNLFYDQVKALSYGHYKYTGSIFDILSVFESNKYKFHWARNPMDINESKIILKMGLKKIPVEERFITKSLHIPLEDVLKR